MTQESEFSLEEVQAYIAGRLDPEAAQRIETRAAEDPTLAGELAIWRGAKGAHAEAVSSQSASEFGWARIEREIDRASAQPANDDAPSGSFWSRPIVAPWQAAAALAVGILAWQFAVVPATIAVDKEPGYVLAGSDAATADEAQTTLRVAFVKTASEGDIRRLLSEVEARIVDGPSAIGFYTLAFDDPQVLDTARARLEASENVIAEIAE